MRLLLDETYQGDRWTYGCRHGRGWTMFGIPDGFIVGSGKADDRYPGGVWDYPSALDTDDCDRFDLVLLTQPYVPPTPVATPTQPPSFPLVRNPADGTWDIFMNSTGPDGRVRFTFCANARSRKAALKLRDTLWYVYITGWQDATHLAIKTGGK